MADCASRGLRILFNRPNGVGKHDSFEFIKSAERPFARATYAR